MRPLASSLCKCVNPSNVTIGFRGFILRNQGLIDAGMTTTEAAIELDVSICSLKTKLKDVGLSWPRQKTKDKDIKGAQTRTLVLPPLQSEQLTYMVAPGYTHDVSFTQAMGLSC